MKFLSEVYKKNNELDDIFISKYSSDKDMFKKNKIELLVEIGELANETKCFKYWSKKEPVRELVLEEYADCIIMTLCLYNYFHMELEDLVYKKFSDINDTFAYLYKMASSVYFTNSQDELKEVLFYLINVAELLNISYDEIIDACLSKINKDTERLLNEN